MTTTPTVWLSQFMANRVAEGIQSDPAVAVLANGNFLVSWRDASDTAAPPASSDIVGSLFDASGRVLAAPFRLNVSATGGDERDPAVAVDAAGGFVVVYESIATTGTGIFWDRYDASGTRIDGDFVAQGDGVTRYVDPSVAFRPDGSFVVSYQRVSGADQSIRAVAVSPAGERGGEIALRNDGTPAGPGSDPRTPDSATLANGVVVTALVEGNEPDVEIRGLNPDGSIAFSGQVTADAISDSDPRVAALAGGGFVVVWMSDLDIAARFYNANGTPASARFGVATGDTNQNEPDVIGLEDGGFFAVWDNDSNNRLEGRRFDARGVPVGDLVVIETDNAATGISATTPELSRMTDGRILVTWRNGEIFTAILDPRESQITVQPGDGVTTARQDGSTVDGSALADIIYGGAGNDRIFGNGGNDRLLGAGGDDLMGGGAGNDVLFGGAGNDRLFGAARADALSGNDGNDSLVGGDGNDTLLGDAGVDTLFGDGGDDLMGGGAGNDLLFGAVGNDRLFGADGADALSGNDGNDFLVGGDGNDTLLGSVGADTLLGDFGNDVLGGGGDNDLVGGGAGNDILYGAGGQDRLFGAAGADTLFGGNSLDRLTGGDGADVLSGGAGADVFVFNLARESTAASRDTVIDFESGSDRIDLSAIDANLDLGGNQAFAFIGSAGFSAAGQLRFVTNGTDGFLVADTDGTGPADMTILLRGLTSFSADDILL